MFRIKICGITSVNDALAAVSFGADAIGLNFYEKSPRYVEPKLAKEIVAAVSGRAKCIGVFVNKKQEEVFQIFALAGLDGIQLHGDETPIEVAQFHKYLQQPLSETMQEIIDDLQQRGEQHLATELLALETLHNPPNLIWARRLGEEGVGAVKDDLINCANAGGIPGAVLVDALTPGRYGGTGETVSWVGLADYKKWIGDVDLILAGGLVPENVAEAIHIVRPRGVDVASGVESAPGIKDMSKMRDFIVQARSAL